MFKKKERLTKKEFDRFFSSGRRFHSPELTLIYSPATDFHGAVVVGKKVYKKAVDRNRLRRRLYDILYSLTKRQGRTGVYMLLTKPAVTSLKPIKLRNSVESLLNKVK